MRNIGTIPDEQQAQRFGDYLLTQGVDNEVEASSSGGFAVWVKDEEQVDGARTDLQTFLDSPDDPRYRAVTRQANALRRESERASAARRKNHVDLRKSWIRSQKGKRPLTLILMAVSVLFTLLTNFADYPHSAATEALLFADPQGLLDPQSADLDLGRGWAGFTSVLHGQVWRLVSPIFLHMDQIHLLFNMWCLYVLGGLVETRKGSLTFGGLVLLIAVTSNVAQCAAAGPFFGGMSGVVYGVFGYAWLKSHYAPHEGLNIDQVTIIMLMAWLVLCMTGMVGRVANTAHVVGLIVGGLAGSLPHTWQAWWPRR
jgi:rhomboid protease GlpG